MVNIRIVITLNTGGILNFTFYSRFLRSLACSCFVGSDDMVEYAILMSEAVSQKGGGFSWSLPSPSSMFGWTGAHCWFRWVLFWFSTKLGLLMLVGSC
jgi:hypothetical protein